MKKTKNNNQTIINYIQQQQMRTDHPSFRAGDQIVVHVKIVENEKQRIQKFRGVVLRKKGSGIAQTFIVKKDNNVNAVERTFQLHSPLIAKIEVLRYGKVRRAYLTYLRNRSTKSARIKERKVK